MSLLLEIKNLKKSYSSQNLFEKANFQVSKGDKIAVIGRNGAGKSTLFKIITNNEEKDDGEISFASDLRIGYLTQHNPYSGEEKLIDYLIESSNKKDFECAKISAQFQIKGELLNQKISAFAGGYQMRIKLIDLLLKEPNLLLLDEPTNYLDLSTQLLLERFLASYKSAFLLISHDREFIKKTCNKTAEIENSKITCYPRPIDEYFTYKQEVLEQKQKHNQKVARQKKHLQKFVDRFGAKASKATQAQSKIKQINRLKDLEIASPIEKSRIKIPTGDEKKGIALELSDLSIGYSEKLVAKNISLTIERGEHIAILGDNGQGKSTFLKTIVGKIPFLNGSMRWGTNLKIGYYAQHVISELNSNETIKDYLERISPTDTTEQQIFEMASNFLFKEDALKKNISVLSGGEKARLCLAGILLQKNNVLLMDEPTNHLDFETVEALANALRETLSTVIFVSHNRTFVDILANGIIEVKNSKVTRYLHNYEDYVYHLKRNIDEDLANNDLNKKNESSNKRKEIRIQIRNLQKEGQKIERKLKKIFKEKEILMRWFDENPAEFSKQKNLKLKELEKQQNNLESEWINLEVEIDNLRDVES